MAVIITDRMLSLAGSAGLPKPIIYCSPVYCLTGQVFPLNRILAEMLISYTPNRRTFQVGPCFQKALAMLPDEPIISDFDVLFHPEYAVDILKIAIRACKVKLFSMIWPGSLRGKKLVYAEFGYRDYKEYDVETYDITCVQGG